VDSAFPKVCGVDSRFRGNDCGLERPCLANDTTTQARTRLQDFHSDAKLLNVPYEGKNYTIKRNGLKRVLSRQRTEILK
jgi:hypothetical protein